LVVDDGGYVQVHAADLGKRWTWVRRKTRRRPMGALIEVKRIGMPRMQDVMRGAA